MKRTAIAVLVGSAALGLLISLALASRTLPVETHVAQYTAAGGLERVPGGVAALVGALDSAWAASQAPGEAAVTLASRIASSAEALPEALFDVPGGAAQRSRVASAYEAFRTAVGRTGTLAAELIEAQTEYAADVAYVRDAGARIVEQMRDIRDRKSTRLNS